MEKEIEKKLQNEYKLVSIKVYFLDFRKYKILIHILHNTIEFEYIWDANYIDEINIKKICYLIDNYIIEYIKKGEL